MINQNLRLFLGEGHELAASDLKDVVDKASQGWTVGDGQMAREANPIKTREHDNDQTGKLGDEAQSVFIAFSSNVGVSTTFCSSSLVAAPPHRMIAYRAETAMVSVVREAMARGDHARSLWRNLFRSEADLLPELEQQILRVHVHPMSNPRSNQAIAHLLQHLNDAAFTYPGMNLRLVYSILGPGDLANPVATQIPPSPEV